MSLPRARFMAFRISIVDGKIVMADRVGDQLKKLGIRDEPGRKRTTQDEIMYIRDFRKRLWSLQSYEDVVRFVRGNISAELSRKLEHIINPPKAMGMAEDVSRDSIKWFVEYWGRACKEYSPDLHVAADNTVVAIWRENNLRIQVRFFSGGYALAAVRQLGKEESSRFWVPARELPTSFGW